MIIACPKCKKKINWYDNIPIISYFILNGKCRKCKKPISFQYVVVELLSIVSFVTIYLTYGFSFTTLLLIILSLGFIIIFFIDLKHFIIPNVLTFSLMIVGFVKSFDPNLNPIFPNYINSLIGGIFGYLIIWSIIFFYKQLRNKEGMGLGDAKLLSAIGFWFGWISIPFILFFTLMGSYIGQNNSTELLILVGFGVCATILKFADYPLAPLLIGFILGSMLEDNFSRSMQLYDGVGFIFERPMTLGLIILAMVLIVLPSLRSRFSKKIGGDVAEGD